MEAGSAALRVDWPVYPRRAEHNTVAEGGNRRWAETARQNAFQSRWPTRASPPTRRRSRSPPRRPRETTRGLADEVYFDKAVLVLPGRKMKMGREHIVPLSDRALEILRALYAHRGRNRHVFPGERSGRPLSRSTVFNQCQRATGGKASVHGWRATFGTWCDEHGVDTIVSELCLAHAKTALAKAYKRGEMIDRRRVVMQDWANWLSGPATAEVIPLPRRA